MAQATGANDPETYVAVAEDPESTEDTNAGSPIHIPCNDDGTLSLSAVDIYYPNVVGLKYQMGKYTRAVKLKNGDFYPPKDGWGVDTIYYCVFRKAPTKRKAIEVESISEPKYAKGTNELEELNKMDDSDFGLAKTILLTGQQKDILFNFLCTSKAAFRRSVNEITIFVDGGRFVRVTLYGTNRGVGDKVGYAPEKLCSNKNIVLITYDGSSENSLLSAKEMTKELKEVCPGCILLVKMSCDIDSFPEVSIQRMLDMSEFIKFNLSNKIDVLQTLKLLIKSSQHVTLENWTALNCFVETPRVFDYANGKLRAYVQNLFSMSSDPTMLINQITEDIKVYSEWHCLRISSIPVVDILRCLLKTKHKSAFGHNFIDVVVNTSKIIYQPMNDYPTRIPCFIIEFIKNENYRPIVFTTKVQYQGDEAQFLTKLPAVTEEESGLEVESTDSNASDNYELDRIAMYKLNSMGHPWRSVSLMNPDLLEQDTQDSLFRVPKAPGKMNENCRVSVVSVPQTTVSSESNVNDSSQASDDAASSVQNVVNRIALDTPSSNEGRVENNDSTSTLNSGSGKESNSRQKNKPERSQSIPRSSQNKNLKKSKSSQDSKGSKKACEQAMVTTVKSNNRVTRMSGDRLVLDVIIYCSNIQLCRYLSALFNLVHLDEILLNFENLKAEKLSNSKIITFNDKGIAGTLITMWLEILDCKDGFHKTIRMIQTRFSEYLNSGRHNIGVTCCEDVLINVYCNAHTMIRLPDEEMKLHLYSIIVTLPDKYNFMDAIAALTKLIDLVLKYPAYTTVPMCFNGQYYTVPLSLISVIPFYILRSYYNSKFKERMGKILMEEAKKVSLI